MSYFRVALRRETEKRQISQVELARQCGLSKSYVSRLMSEEGESATLSDGVVVAILGAFSADKRA
jgi:transcriptional regulator with XRE-family HTH domain